MNANKDRPDRCESPDGDPFRPSRLYRPPKPRLSRAARPPGPSRPFQRLLGARLRLLRRLAAGCHRSPSSENCHPLCFYQG